MKEAEVKVLTRSQAEAEAKLDVNDNDAVAEDLWSAVEPEESEEGVLGDELSASVGRDEVEPVQETAGSIVRRICAPKYRNCSPLGYKSQIWYS